MSDPFFSTNQNQEFRTTLNRPDDMNTLTIGLVDALHDALSTVHADHDCRAVVLTGAGRAFCAGLDLQRLWNHSVPNPSEHRNREWQLHNTLLRLFTRCDLSVNRLSLQSTGQPPVAALRACASDIRYCSDNAKFGTASFDLEFLVAILV